MVAARPWVALSGASTSGLLAEHRSDVVLRDAELLLADVPPLKSLSDNSLRFAAMPSFGRRWMAVALARTKAGAVGNLAVLDRAAGTVSKRKVQVTARAYDEMMKRWDSEADGYWGDMRMWADGSPLGFERRRGRHITSGIGNSPCHYDGLGNLAAIYLGPQIPELLDLRAPEFDKLKKSDAC